MEHSHRVPMTGKTVVVTGGTAGIGRATALGLAGLGAHLAITGRDRARAEDAARELRAAGGGQVDVFMADLSSQSEVRRLADELLHPLARIEVLVNNVGGCWSTRHITADGLERTFALAPAINVDRLADEDYIEDELTISRVEPSQLWFEDDIGPVKVPRAGTDLARPGWSVSLALGRVREQWRIVQVGNVYPR